jgi:hypothetical protein
MQQACLTLSCDVTSTLPYPACLLLVRCRDSPRYGLQEYSFVAVTDLQRRQGAHQPIWISDNSRLVLNGDRSTPALHHAYSGRVKLAFWVRVCGLQTASKLQNEGLCIN